MIPVFRTFGRHTVSAVAALVLALGIVYSQPVFAQTVDATWKFIEEMVQGKATYERNTVAGLTYTKVDHRIEVEVIANAFGDGEVWGNFLVSILDDLGSISLSPTEEKGTKTVGVEFRCKGETACLSRFAFKRFSNKAFKPHRDIEESASTASLRFSGSSAAERVLKAFQHLHKLALSDEQKAPF